ncbi:MAG: hypothetical protein HFE73_07930 [Firmicutes bacterium]|nr:hypothetical protein [Bacillota bacterium]
MNEKGSVKLFFAIGEAEEGLLRRSEEAKTEELKKGIFSWVRGGADLNKKGRAGGFGRRMAMATGLVMAACVLFMGGRMVIMGEEDFTGEMGVLHLLEFCYAQDMGDTVDTAKEGDIAGDSAQFFINVDENRYTTSVENGDYIIRPLVTSTASTETYINGVENDDNTERVERGRSLIRVHHREAVTIAAAAAEKKESLKQLYAKVSNVTETKMIEEGSVVMVSAWERLAAGPERVDVYFVDDEQGGVFEITAAYYAEATGTQGVMLQDIISTFRVRHETEAEKDYSEEQDWLGGLEEAVGKQVYAQLSNYYNLEDVDFRTLDYRFTMDKKESAAQEGMNYAAEVEEPHEAVVSVGYVRPGEDSLEYLTMGFVYDVLENGQKGWQLTYSGIEK